MPAGSASSTLLREDRPRQPLNGVLVAFSADLLSRLDAQPARRAHARAVRQRIQELDEKLGAAAAGLCAVQQGRPARRLQRILRRPRPEDAQPGLGHDLPGRDRRRKASPAFAAEFDRAAGHGCRTGCSSGCRPSAVPTQRAAIVGFPQQFASLGARSRPSSTGAFGGTRLDPAPLLRGVYFTSRHPGRHADRPADRRAVPRLRARPAPAPSRVLGQKGRSYFLGRLLRDVVFNEARLAARDRGPERRRAASRSARWSLSALLVVGGAASAGPMPPIPADSGAQQRLRRRRRGAEGGRRGLRFDPVAGRDDLGRVLPYLDAARRLPAARGYRAARSG